MKLILNNLMNKCYLKNSSQVSFDKMEIDLKQFISEMQLYLSISSDEIRLLQLSCQLLFQRIFPNLDEIKQLNYRGKAWMGKPVLNFEQKR